MKKMKKWIVPLLVMLLVPLTLAGCSFGKTTTPQKSLSDGQVWYAIDHSDNDQIEYALSGSKNKLTIIPISTNKNNKYLYYKDVEKINSLSDLKKLLKDRGYDYHIWNENVKYNIFIDGNKKTQEENIVSSDDNIAILSDKEYSFKNGLSGFKLEPTPDDSSTTIYNSNQDNAYLVTKAKKVSLDSNNDKNVVVYNMSDRIQIENQDGYGNGDD